MIDKHQARSDRQESSRSPLGCSLTVIAAVLWLGAVGVAAPPASGQDRESHHWIVLLDVSSSFEGRAKLQGPSREDYRLRNEALSLLQTLLAARRVKEQERRDDHLSVYVFGKGVARVQELTTRPVIWSDINDPQWWEKQIPSGLGARTNYFEALHLAVEDFKSDRPETTQHLVLISDGELDVGEENRQPGAPPGREEIAVYRNLLRRDTEPLNWLHDQGVQVHTLAVDEGLASYNDAERQKKIRNTLYDYQFGGATPLERARALVEDLGGRVAESGKLVESEGPYVMAALAQAFNGEARSVRFDNILDVLWETLFPEQVSRRILPLGTTKAIIFAPREAPVRIKVEEGGEPEELALSYDPGRDSYRVDPEGPWPDLRVNVRATSQYATWMVLHPKLLEIDPEHQLAEERDRFSIVPVTNVGFVWHPERPPPEALGDAAIPLTLDLVWQGDPPEPTREEWRHYLEQTALVAEGEVEEPDGSTTEVLFRTSVPAEATDVVLRLEASFSSRLEGDHEVRARLTLGDAPESPQIKAEPVLFNILLESPLSVEGRFVLHLRPWEQGELGEGVVLSPADAGLDKSPQTIWVDSKDVVAVIAEWRGKNEEGCEGVERLSLALLELNRTFGREANEIPPDDRPQEGGRLICYRSPGVRIEPDRWGEPLTVEARDGLKSVPWRWQVKRRTPFWVKVLYAALLALAGALILLAILRRRQLLRWMDRRRAPFPLVVDLPGGALAWPGTGAKRFVVSLDDQGELHGEVGKRQPGGDEKAVVVEPSRKYAYQVRVAAGPSWNLERVDEHGRSLGTRPLNKSGETVTLLELTRGHKIHFERDGAVASLRHENR